MDPELEQELLEVTEDAPEQIEEQPEAPIEAPQITPEAFAAYAEQMGMQLVPQHMMQQQQPQEEQFQAPQVPDHIQEMGYLAEQKWIADQSAQQAVQQVQQQMMMQQAPMQFQQIGQQIANGAGRPDTAEAVGQFLMEKLGGNFIAWQQEPGLAEVMTLAAEGFINKQIKPLADNSPPPRTETIGRQAQGGSVPIPPGWTRAEADSYIQQMTGGKPELRATALEALAEFAGGK